MTKIATNPIADYVTALITDFLGGVEGAASLPYYDQAPVNSSGEYQNVTIGDGINIDWSNTLHLKLVLAKLGLVDSSNALDASSRAAAGLPPETDAERTARLNGMVLVFQQTMINDRPPAGAPLSDVLVANAKLQADLNNLSAAFGGGPFQFDTNGTMSEAVIRQIIEGGVSIPDFINFPASKGLQAQLDAKLGNTSTNINLAHNTKEYEAVMSMFYNTPGTVGKNLVAAIKGGDRAEAWFEIRYNTNKNALSATPPSDALGIAKG